MTPSLLLSEISSWPALCAGLNYEIFVFNKLNARINCKQSVKCPCVSLVYGSTDLYQNKTLIHFVKKKKKKKKKNRVGSFSDKLDQLELENDNVGRLMKNTWSWWLTNIEKVDGITNDQHETVNTGMKTDHLQKDFKLKLWVMKFFLLCSSSSLSSLTGMSMPMAMVMAILVAIYKILPFSYLNSIKFSVSCGLRAAFSLS